MPATVDDPEGQPLHVSSQAVPEIKTCMSKTRANSTRAVPAWFRIGERVLRVWP